MVSKILIVEDEPRYSSRVFIIQSIVCADTDTCERDLLIPIVAKIEESRDKREMPLPQRIFMNTPHIVELLVYNLDQAGFKTEAVFRDILHDTLFCDNS